MKTGLSGKLSFQQRISDRRHEVKFGGNKIIIDLLRREKHRD